MHVVLPGLVMLDLGVSGGLDDSGEEMVGVVDLNTSSLVKPKVIIHSDQFLTAL